MKKLLLIAAIAAASMSANAASFSDYFAITVEDQPVLDGETVTVKTYYDPIEMSYPGEGFGEYESKVAVKAINVSNSKANISFTLTQIEPTKPNENMGYFKLCYDFNDKQGQCLTSNTGIYTSPSDLDAVSVDGYLLLDIEHVQFTDLTPVTFKLQLSTNGVGGTIYIKFTHEQDITMAVDGIEADSASEEYFNLQGVKVANPEKGNIYIVRKGSKVSKRLF